MKSLVVGSSTAPGRILKNAQSPHALARQYGLTIDDAAYLELAMRRGATLATTDLAFTKSATAAGGLTL